MAKWSGHHPSWPFQSVGPVSIIRMINTNSHVVGRKDHLKLFFHSAIHRNIPRKRMWYQSHGIHYSEVSVSHYFNFKCTIFISSYCLHKQNKMQWLSKACFAEYWWPYADPSIRVDRLQLRQVQDHLSNTFLYLPCFYLTVLSTCMSSFV